MALEFPRDFKLVELTADDIKAIRALVDRAELNTTSIVMEIHKLVIAKLGVEWDSIKQLNDYIYCNKETWTRICQWFMHRERIDNEKRAFDKQVMPGGPWLNYGFSAAEPIQRALKDWWVAVPTFTMQEGK